MHSVDKTIVKRAFQIFLVFLMMLTSAAFHAQETAVIFQKGTPLFEETAASVKTAVSAKALIPIEKDKEEEAKSALALEKDAIVCAIGPAAITAVFQAGIAKGVAVGLPNPLSRNYSTKKDFLFVSIYPEPRIVLEYLGKNTGAKSFGIIFTKSVNQEMADFFKAQTEAAGFKCKQLGVDSAQDLTAPFPYFLGQVDAALILIDPLAYSKDAVKFMVTKALEKKVPLYGFNEQIASSGVPVALFVQSRELTQATTKAVGEMKSGSSKNPVYFCGDFKLSINQESAKAFGSKFDESKVAKRY